MLGYHNAPKGMTGRSAVVAVVDVVKEERSSWE
jgi:hypothetical protein